MKQLLIVLFLPILGFGQQTNELILRSEIKKVKLFLTAGEMTHESPLQLKKGRNKIIYTGISAFADPNSIQFTASGNFRLVSVSTEMDFLAAEQFNPKIKVLKDSLDQFKDKHQANQDLMGAYNAELAVLNTNRDLKGANQNLTVEQLKLATEFYRTKTLELNKNISKLQREQRILDEKIADTRRQLTELNYNENQRSNQVIILIDCDEATKLDATLRYIVSDCGWAATYDLSAVDVNQPVHLKYKAQVYNNTGNEWKDVQLTLSTSDPTLSASAPTLNPFYVQYGQQIEQQRLGYVQTKQNDDNYRYEVMNEINMANQRAYDNWVLDEKDQNRGDVLGGVYLESEKMEVKKVATVQMKQIQISELNADFPIKHTFTCPSDAKPYLVEIKEIDIPATFTHISVPKLDQGAFLLANIVGWQDLDLIPGPTNVYFGGNYVGMSEIDTRTMSDTMSLSFGRDPRIQVIRKLKSEMSVKKVSGSTKRDTYYYDIQLRNNRSTPVTIDVFDQVPLSRNSEITITTETIGTGVKDDLTGEVKYKVTLQPGELVNLEIGYTVKYPKNASVSVKTFRTISAPSF